MDSAEFDAEFEEHIEAEAFDWGIDYKPWETDLDYREYARYGYVQGYKQACRNQLPEGMRHCTITFHQCSLGHGWLSATNWIQHGCPTCERNKLREQTMEKYIEREFKKNLELAYEETDATDRLAWQMAVEWTVDDIANQIGRQLENKWWKKQDDINKAFYE